jgi:hypothetical protein
MSPLLPVNVKVPPGEPALVCSLDLRLGNGTIRKLEALDGRDAERSRRPRCLCRLRCPCERSRPELVRLWQLRCEVAMSDSRHLQMQGTYYLGVTFRLSLARAGTDLAGRKADHAETLRFVGCADLLLSLAEGHAVLKLTELGPSADFLGIVSPVAVA